MDLDDVLMEDLNLIISDIDCAETEVAQVITGFTRCSSEMAEEGGVSGEYKIPVFKSRHLEGVRSLTEIHSVLKEVYNVAYASGNRKFYGMAAAAMEAIEESHPELDYRE